MLTDKAKTEFWKWFLLPETLKRNKLSAMVKFSNENAVKVHFLALPESCQHALIIDWFSTLKYKNENFWLHVFEFYYEMRIDGMTISDINLQAIEKANENFNLKE